MSAQIMTYVIYEIEMIFPIIESCNTTAWQCAIHRVAIHIHRVVNKQLKQVAYSDLTDLHW